MDSHISQGIIEINPSWLKSPLLVLQVEVDIWLASVLSPSSHLDDHLLRHSSDLGGSLCRYVGPFSVTCLQPLYIPYADVTINGQKEPYICIDSDNLMHTHTHTDAIRVIYKYGGEIDVPGMTLDAKIDWRLKDCRGQRNFWITGFALFLIL